MPTIQRLKPTAQARGRVLLGSYIVEDGGVAAEVAESLLQEAAAGVQADGLLRRCAAAVPPQALAAVTE